MTVNTSTAGSHTKLPTAVFACKCSNAGQDKLYGSGRRLFNPCKAARLKGPWEIRGLTIEREDGTTIQFSGVEDRDAVLSVAARIEADAAAHTALLSRLWPNRSFGPQSFDEIAIFIEEERKADATALAESKRERDENWKIAQDWKALRKAAEAALAAAEKRIAALTAKRDSFGAPKLPIIERRDDAHVYDEWDEIDGFDIHSPLYPYSENLDEEEQEEQEDYWGFSLV